MRCETKRNGDFMFMRNEYLKWNQLQSFWSREAKKQQRAGASHASSNQSRWLTAEEIEDNEAELEDGQEHEPDPSEEECEIENKYTEDPNLLDTEDDDLEALIECAGLEIEQ